MVRSMTHNPHVHHYMLDSSIGISQHNVTYATVGDLTTLNGSNESFTRNPLSTNYLHATSDSIIPLAWQVFMVVVLMFTTITANSVMCYAVYKTPNLRTITNIFTVNLGIIDLCISVVSLPMLMITLTQYQVSFPSPDFCTTVSFITLTLLLASVATLAGISLDRYFCICHPLRYPMEVTCRRGYLALAYIWLQSIVLAATPLMGWGTYTFRPQSVPICFPKWTANLGHAAFFALVGLGIPFALMVFSYVRIIQEARIQTQHIKELQLAAVANEVVSTCKNEDKDELMPGARRLSIFTPRWRRPSINSAQSQSNGNKNIKTLKTVFIVVGK